MSEVWEVKCPRCRSPWYERPKRTPEDGLCPLCRYGSPTPPARAEAPAPNDPDDLGPLPTWLDDDRYNRRRREFEEARKRPVEEPRR